jgi:hypothetical protein
MSMGGGGGQTQTSAPNYSPEQQQLQRLAIDTMHRSGILGPEFYSTHPAASMGPWQSDVRNQAFSAASQMAPQFSGQDWQRQAQAAAQNNPLAGAVGMTPQAQGCGPRCPGPVSTHADG